MTLKELRRSAILFVASAILFLFPFLRGRTLFLGDTTYSFQPWLTYAAQEIQAGRWPLWNPYSACGEPFMANPQVMLLNPTAIAYWMFPFAPANGIFLSGCLAMLYLFTYLLARQWIGSKTSPSHPAHASALLGALALTWGGYSVTHWEFPSAMATLPFLPLFLMLGMAQRWVAMGISTSLVLLAGYTQFAYYAVFLGTAGFAFNLWDPHRPWSQHRRSLLAFSSALVVGVLAAAVQWMPSRGAAVDSLRDALTSGDARTHLLTPVHVLKLWIPRLTNPAVLTFQTVPFGAEHWTIQRPWLSTLFMGTPVCLLAAAGWFRGGRQRMVTLTLVGVLGGVLALGIEPVFTWLRTLVPGLNYLTHFSNAGGLLLLCVVLGSTESAHPRRGRNVLLAVATASLLAPALGLALSPTLRQRVLFHLLGLPSLTADQDRWVMEAGGTAAMAVLLFAGVWLFYRHKRWAVLWFMTLIELGLFKNYFIRTADGSFFHHRPAACTLPLEGQRLSVSPHTMKSPRGMAGDNLVEGVISVRDLLYPNIGVPYRIHHTWGYEVFGFREFAQFRRRLPDLPDHSPALDFLGARWMITTEPLTTPPTGARANALLYERPGAMKLVTAVSRHRVLSNAEERLAYLFGPWAPIEEVVLEEEAGQKPAESRPVIDTWSVGTDRWSARGHGRGWVVHSGVLLRGWGARVNGSPAPIHRANHAFQAVSVPDGDWVLEARYLPSSFKRGLALSLIVVLTGMTTGFVLLSKRRDEQR